MSGFLFASAALAQNTSSFTPVADWEWPLATGYVAGRAAGDVDGDGDDELVVVTDSRVTLFLGDPSGLPLAFDREWPVVWGSAALADLDADGYDDLIVADPYVPFGLGTVSVYPGGPGGLAVSPSSTVTGTSWPVGHWLVGAGDLDADGHEDLLVAEESLSDPRWAWWRGTTGGLVRATFEVAPYLVAVTGDVDGDGDRDVVGLRDDSRTVDLFPGSPGGPTTPASFTWVSDPGWLATADLTGDGLDDLVVYDWVAAAWNLSVFEGDAFGLPATPDLVTPAPGSFAGGGVYGVGDLDVDGLGDVIVATGNQAWRLSGLPGPAPWPDEHDVASSSYTDWDSAGIVGSSGDFDGDGCLDLVLDAYVAWIQGGTPAGYGLDTDDESVIAVWYCGTPSEDTGTAPGDSGGSGATATPGPDGGPTTDTGDPPAAPTEEEPKDPGGCGCRSASGAGPWVLLLAAVALRYRKAGPRQATGSPL